MRPLRIAVCNVQSGLGTRRGWWDYAVTARHRFVPRLTRHIERIGTALLDAEVHLAVFTEVDGGSARTAHVDQARLLAEHGGFRHHAFFPCFSVGTHIHQGNAVHGRSPVLAVRNHPLAGFGEPRFLSEAAVGPPDGPLQVFAAHTSLDAAVRSKQLREIRDHVAATRGPILLAGDFNARQSRELEHLTGVLAHVPVGPTFPSWRPRWWLDHLFVSPHFRVRAARVMHEVREADHLPLLIDLMRL